LPNSRFYIQKKRSRTHHSLHSFYGSWKAGIYFNNGPHHAALIRVGTRFYKIPPKLMILFKPFNRYTHTEKGEKFV